MISPKCSTMMRFDSYKEIAPPGKLHLFSVYTDFGACRRIRWVVSAIAQQAGRQWQCSSEMWKLDSFIAHGPIRKMVADDGANADALIVVIGSLDQRRPELMDWLESLAPLPPGRSGLLIGVLGDEEDKAKELDWTAKQLIHYAQKTNRRFVWHWMQHHDREDLDWLADGVDTLLARKKPAHRHTMTPEVAMV